MLINSSNDLEKLTKKNKKLYSANDLLNSNYDKLLVRVGELELIKNDYSTCLGGLDKTDEEHAKFKIEYSSLYA